MKISWKTLSFALVIAGGVILTQIGYALDDDPMTKTNWDILTKAIGTLLEVLGLGGLGWVARDNSVSDEQAGAGVTKRTVELTEEEYTLLKQQINNVTGLKDIK